MDFSARATIRDLAKAAGVSPTTVSHALNGKGNVSERTAERVRRMAAEMNYRPSEIARGLQQQRTGILALIIRPFRTLDTVLPNGVDYFLRVVGTASLAAMENNYTLMLVDDPSRPGVPFGAQAADAYIVTEPYENDPVLTYLSQKRKPFLTLGADPARKDAFISIDEGSARDVELMLSHLTRAGAGRIAIVTGTDRNQWNLATLEAARAWLDTHGQEPLVMSVPEVEGENAGEAIVDEFFGAADRDRPDAIYCLTGRHASGVVRAALSRGIRVPQDLLVAAASGSIQNRVESPTITTLDLKPEEIARTAVECAIELAEGRPLQAVPAPPPATLDIRESTTR